MIYYELTKVIWEITYILIFLLNLLRDLFCKNTNNLPWYGLEKTGKNNIFEITLFYKYVHSNYLLIGNEADIQYTVVTT